MVELRIDEEFENLIPALTSEEFNQLRENIIEKDEVINPILTWHGVIVDGHNRWKIIQENPGIPFKTYEMIFADRYEAKDWIIKNQIGRRNLNQEQKLRLIGHMQENRKKSHGGDRKSEESKGQNEPLKSTAAQIAEEVGVSESTVKRAEKFSKGIDVLKEVAPAAADKILKGGSGVTKAEVMSVPNMEQEERDEFVERVINPQPKEEKKLEPYKYTVDDLLKEIESNGWEFTKHLKETLVKRSTLYSNPSDRMRVHDAVYAVMQNIGILEKLLCNKE
jgi:hypothetical protein